MGLPVIGSGVAARAKQVWSDSIQTFGRDVLVKPNDDSTPKGCKAFCKRPKILGLFDRTEQSFDQTRYVVMLRAEDFPAGFVKFDRVRWDNEDHAVISVTEVEMAGLLFGFRVLVKG